MHTQLFIGLLVIGALGHFVERTAAQDCRADVVFVVDSSSSVGLSNFKLQMRFIESLVNGLALDSGDVRVGILTYSTAHQVHFQLNTHSSKHGAITNIRKIPYIFGSTNTQEGITVMTNKMFTIANGDRPDVPNIAIVMTDGISNIDSKNTIPSAVAARRLGIHVFAIGIGLVDKTAELDGIASVPIDENRFAVADFQALLAIRETLFRQFCREARKLAPSPPPTPPARRFVAPAIGCDMRADIVFVVDASSSVGGPNFKKVLKFIQNLLEGAKIDEGDVRVGLLSFSTEINLHFYLNKHTKKKKVPTATLR